MKNWNKTTRVVLATLATGGALFAASSAFAQSAPYMQPAPGPVYEQPHMMPVGVSINIGWHGDRYWDGHRYWAHDEWMHHHPHDPGPQHWHDDHHPDHRY